MRQRLTIIILALMFLYGCGKRESVFMDCIESASEFLDEDKPDSAYTVLMGLDKAVPKMTEAERMRYEVCRVNAMNKMFVSLKDEEEAMMRAVEYYEKHGSPDEKMGACLLLGSVYRDIGDAPQALEWFDKAIIHGEKGTNKTQLAKIHGQKTDLFINQRMFEDALVEVGKMESISRALDEKSLLINAMSIKSTIEYCMGDYQESVNTYKEASSILCNSLHDTVRAARIAASSIASYMRMERYRDAEELFDFYERHSGLFDDEGDILAGYESFYLDKGDYYAAIGDLQKSISFYNKGIMAQDVNNKCMAYYKLANVYSDMSLSDSVAKYALLACGYSQKYFEELQTNTLQQIEATYNYGRYKQEGAEKALEAERTRNFTYVLLSIFALSLGAISFAWYRWRSKKRQELEVIKSDFEQSKSEALQLSASRRELAKQLEEKNTIIEQLSMSATDSAGMSELDELRRETDSLRSALQDAERRYKNILERGENIVPSLLLKLDSGETRLSNGEWEDLEMYVAKIYPSFLPNLFKVLPGLKKEHARIAILVKLGFTPTQMNQLLSLSIQAVSNARRRMYEKAHNGAVGTAELADEWIKGL